LISFIFEKDFSHATNDTGNVTSPLIKATVEGNALRLLEFLFSIMMFTIYKMLFVRINSIFHENGAVVFSLVSSVLMLKCFYQSIAKNQ
jgi:hypothetical protein